MKTLHQKIAAALAGILLFTLSACGTKPAASSAASENVASQPGIANPMKEIDFFEMVDSMGLPAQVPEDTEQANYYSITTGGYPIGQVNFTAAGTEYTLRLQMTDEVTLTDISGMYYTWAEEHDVQVSYCNARLCKCEDAAVIYWLDIVPGIAYSLSVNGPVDTDELCARANQCFAPYQDDTVFDSPEAFPTRDYTGSYIAEDGSTADFTFDGQQYTVEIGITRLCQLTGTGNAMDGAVELELTDPSEGTMYGIFFPAEDGESYTLTITQSTWSLIENGTQFTGFIPQA